MDNQIDGQGIERRNMETMKELTVENVEKIAKLLARVSLVIGEQKINKEEYSLNRDKSIEEERNLMK
jgi:hypothetical protein